MCEECKELKIELEKLKKENEEMKLLSNQNNELFGRCQSNNLKMNNKLKYLENVFESIKLMDNLEGNDKDMLIKRIKTLSENMVEYIKS